MEIRLQKYFTDCGVLSRRAAEGEIRKGLVLVNGVPAEIGQKIDPRRDTVTYRGRVVSPATGTHHYILLNKPRGFVTTLSDEKGRPTVATLVESLGCRVYPVGRLDMDSDGLLLLTDDGELTHRLTHPRHDVPKYYRVTVRQKVTAEQLERLNKPFELDGYLTRPARVAPGEHEADTPADATVLTVELREGRNRQIRRMCEAVGLSILRLTRIALGSIPLGDLPIGHYRALTADEVDYLKGATHDLGDPN